MNIFGTLNYLLPPRYLSNLMTAPLPAFFQTMCRKNRPRLFCTRQPRQQTENESVIEPLCISRGLRFESI